MTTNATVRVPEAELPEGRAEQLVAAARAQGVDLTGPQGLMTGLTRRVLETALEVEMTEHVRHEHGDPPGPSGNVRNGHSPKTVRTEIGEVTVKVPRDRAGTFMPGSTRPSFSLYAKGMTAGDIANHLADVYGTEFSRDLVSRVTDAVVEQMQSW